MKIKNKNFRIYLLIIIGVVIVTLIGISFAYFSTTVTNDASADVTVTLPDQASLTFSKSGDLLIDATMSNFAEDKGNLSESSTSTVTLNASGDYSANYYVYFEILLNDFEYTQSEDVAELILVITDSNGDAVKSISGLNYTTSGDVEGFDVTTATGLFAVSSDESISLSDGKTEESESYNFTLYFINLDGNQNNNTAKKFISEIIIQERPYYPVVAITPSETSTVASLVLTAKNEISSIVAGYAFVSSDSECLAATYSMTNTITITENGTYYACIIDEDDNIGYSYITISNIDSTPPTVTLSKSTSSYTSSLTITATGSDDTEVVGYAFVSSASECSTATYTTTDTKTITENGTYYACVIDGVGNTGYAHITIDLIYLTVFSGSYYSDYVTSVTGTGSAHSITTNGLYVYATGGSTTSVTVYGYIYTNVDMSQYSTAVITYSATKSWADSGFQLNFGGVTTTLWEGATSVTVDISNASSSQNDMTLKVVAASSTTAYARITIKSITLYP